MTTNCMSRSPRQSSRGLHQPPRLLLLTVPVPALSLWGWHVVALIFMAPTAEGGKFADSYPMSKTARKLPRKMAVCLSTNFI